MNNYKLFLFTALCLSACSPLSQEPITTPTLALISTPIPTATPTPTLVPTPTQMGGGSGKVIFAYTKEGFKDDFPDLRGSFNVFISNLDGTDLVALTDGNMGVEAISPDGNKVLISEFTGTRKKDTGAKLYLFDLNDIDSGLIHLASRFSQNSLAPAAGWINNSEIVYLARGDEGYGFYVMNIDNFDVRKLSPLTKNPEAILGVNEERVYWYTKVDKKYFSRTYKYNTVWWTNIDGSGQGKLETNGVQVEYSSNHIDFSPDGKMIAWQPSAPQPECDTTEKQRGFDSVYERVSTCELIYAAYLVDMDHPIKVPHIPSKENIPEIYRSTPTFYFLAWSPNEPKLFILHPGESYTVKSILYQYPAQMFSIDFNQSKPEFVWLDKFPSVDDDLDSPWMPTISGFSPDGRQIFINKITADNEYQLISVDLESMVTVETEIPYGLNHDEVYSVYLLPKSDE
jgi:hypothetical protein